MTEEIKAGSKLLAEFEGKELHKSLSAYWDENEDGGTVFFPLAYHADYNELHRVWRKFRDSAKTNPKTFEDTQMKAAIGYSILYSSHEEAFTKIVEGVKYLNSLKPKEEK